MNVVEVLQALQANKMVDETFRSAPNTGREEKGEVVVVVNRRVEAQELVDAGASLYVCR